MNAQELRQKAWDNSFHTFGKGYIFDKRAEKYSKYVNLLKVFGIVTPVVVGATAMGYRFDAGILKYVITIAIPVTIAQLIFSVFAVVFKWDDELAYAYEASQEYNNISNSFRKLAQIPPEDLIAFDRTLELLETRYQARSEQDAKHSVKEWELRKGMRFALREFQRECVGCNIKPTSIESTSCNVCGKFETEFKKGVREWFKKFIR
ncbi:MAG: hypothetical protein KJ620_07415 [Candidatus Edwardsbacteria bacterium]|nr:hypothetical protein [Candidatus Edwardsbacteria bacterium]MBU1577754.1 hypothetical protein [Candidatus Edwardsbacteria bacterium]MBU2462551.1 hypothetical protein [Candidatus Edwardsbacteria bacterium]